MVIKRENYYIIPMRWGDTHEEFKIIKDGRKHGRQFVASPMFFNSLPMFWGENWRIRDQSPSVGEKKRQSYGSWWKRNTSHVEYRGVIWVNSHWSLLYFKPMKNRHCRWLAGMAAACLRWWSEEHTGSYFCLESLAVSQPSRGLRRQQGREGGGLGAGVQQIPTVSSGLRCFTPTDWPST